VNIKLGTIIRWDCFPYARYGEKGKARWLICVGSQSGFLSVACLYMCTTTTRIENFKSGGNRDGHKYFVFKKDQYGMFEEDCAIDFSEKPYFINPKSIPEGDIEIKGEFSEQTIRMIYNNLLAAGCLSFMELLDMHTSLNLSGITGLQKPKPRLR